MVLLFKSFNGFIIQVVYSPTVSCVWDDTSSVVDTGADVDNSSVVVGQLFCVVNSGTESVIPIHCQINQW